MRQWSLRSIGRLTYSYDNAGNLLDLSLSNTDGAMATAWNRSQKARSECAVNNLQESFFTMQMAIGTIQYGVFRIILPK